MCGIAGFISNKEVNIRQISKALELLGRRGPDANGYKVFTESNRTVGLLHTRLSILDLDPRSNQPFNFEHLTLVFNGEIYNYIEVRQELIKSGYAFQTSSDTEVLIKGWHFEGEKILDRLEGMWAFAIYDQREKALYLCRDRFAEKPLYYLKDDNGFYFGSEIKVLPCLNGKSLQVNERQIYRYIVNTHKSLYKSNETFYHNIYEIDYGEVWKIAQNGKIIKSKYWKPAYAPRKCSEDEVVEKIKDNLIHSVKLRLRSDVPVAFCLSGGVDSSALVSIATKVLNKDVQTFSIIDPDERYNETENMLATIRDTGCKNQLIELSPEYDYAEQLKKLIDYHDGPVSTISYLVHSRLVEAMHAEGYKVSISGTAADELFTGYYDHFLYHLAVLNTKDRETAIGYWKQYPAKFVRNPLLQDPLRFVKEPDNRNHIYLNNNIFREFMKADFKEEFREESYSSDILRNRMLNELFHEVVRVILHEDDLNTMYYSIENRSPFLDRQLFETAYSIPSNLLINKGYNKYLLREAMKDILNDTVRLSREKKGFNASVNSLFDLQNQDQRAMMLDDSPIFDLIDKRRMEALLERGEYPNSYKKFLFNFLNCKIFFESYTRKSLEKLSN